MGELMLLLGRLEKMSLRAETALLGATYASGTTLLCGTAAWGINRLGGEKQEWWKAVVGSAAGATVATVLAASVRPTDWDSFGMIAVLSALNIAPALGAVIGLHL